MKILAVIPARGGSKGIPRKNLRFMCGQPLISYAIKNALNSKFIDETVVTTDDTEIAMVAKCYGSKVIKRNSELAKDAVTLDPVIYDAVRKIEDCNNCKYDIVITLQPTSPLLTTKTLDNAIQEFINKDLKTCISVVNRPHLSWGIKNGKILPKYKERLNRQQLPPDYMETGAFFITRRQFIKENTRLGNSINVFEVPEKESIDIDSVEDWVVAESILNRKNIIFRADGMKERGMGHIYNCITMAFNLIAHNVLFVTRKDCLEGLKKIQSTNFHYVTIDTDDDIDQIIDDFKPDIWVNDCLNTSIDYMKHLKNKVKRLISIEDIGPGTRYADAVINALYEKQKTFCAKTYEGPNYVCLRNEFLIEKPKELSAKVKRIMIMFGGTDPSNLNKKLYAVALELSKSYPDIVFDFVTGIGYDAEQNQVINNPDAHIFIHSNVSKVTDYMKLADLAVTSQGRTIFEIASMGVPAVIIAQNERELEHTFATMKNGFINLGLGTQVDSQAILNTLKWLIDTPNIRFNMHQLMLKQDLRSSTKKLKRIILGDENE